MTMAARDTPDRRAGREPARRPLTWFDSPEEQALIAPWNAGRGAPLADVRHAAEQGHDAAQHALAYRHEHGDGVDQDDAQALHWLQLAAEGGRTVGLAVLHDLGQGVPQDFAEAARLFRLAAEQGHARGQLHLADAYHHGEGVTKNPDAAEQGNGIARIFLKYRYPPRDGEQDSRP